MGVASCGTMQYVVAWDSLATLGGCYRLDDFGAVVDRRVLLGDCAGAPIGGFVRGFNANAYRRFVRCNSSKIKEA